MQGINNLFIPDCACNSKTFQFLYFILFYFLWFCKLKDSNFICICRYCLWILGNGTTLLKSDSVWKKLVLDARERQCFYNAEEDQKLALAITAALVELGKLDILLNDDSLLFREARWKVHAMHYLLLTWVF